MSYCKKEREKKRRSWAPILTAEKHAIQTDKRESKSSF